MAQQSRDAAIAPPLRAVLAQLADAGGILPRNMLDDALAHLDKAGRHHLRKGGITIGSLDIFHPALLKPGAAQWRLALLAARHDKPMRSEEHTSELQSLMRNSYAVFCLKKKKDNKTQ